MVFIVQFLMKPIFDILNSVELNLSDIVGEMYSFFFCYIYGAFIVQTVFCFAFKKNIAKNVPMFFIGFDMILCFLYGLKIPIIVRILDGDQPKGFIDLGAWLYFFAIVLTILGVVAAWIFYTICQWLLKSEKLRREALKYEKPIGEINT